MNRKQLVKSKCANYKEGICLLRDIECPLVTAFKYRNHEFQCEEARCGYFDKHVLGDKPLNDTTETKPVLYNIKKCKACNKVFKPANSVNKYCSESCKKLARKKVNCKYYQASK